MDRPNGRHVHGGGAGAHATAEGAARSARPGGLDELTTGSLAIDAGGVHAVLLPQRAAWLRERSTLLVADLHLGKCEAMRVHGAPIPMAVLDEELERLGMLTRLTRCRRVLVLGDLLHASVGVTPHIVDRVASARREWTCEVAVVPGNHDRVLARVADAWNLELLPAVVREAGLIFRHDPPPSHPLAQSAWRTALEHDEPEPRGGGDAAGADAFTWCGHLHPALGTGDRGGSQKVPCFVVWSGLGVLPAFSRFTAGSPMTPGPGIRTYAIAEGRVSEI